MSHVPQKKEDAKIFLVVDKSANNWQSMSLFAFVPLTHYANKKIMN
jgi:hypothetical protein